MEVPAPADDGARFLRRLLADGIRPDPRRSVAEWAEQAPRIVAEGAYEGAWRNDRTPYLTEIMQRASLICPTRRVTLLGSAQIGKTQVGVNLAGQILCETPAQALIVLPSINTLRMYNRDKLDRMIQATPALQAAVADVVERSGQGSTVAVKVGARGAQVELVTASSSRDLQGRTSRVVIMEEVPEWPLDVGGRGSPVEQALARTIQWRKRGEKVVMISTPGIKGACIVTAWYLSGSQGLYVLPCPRCDARHPLVFANLRWPTGKPEKAEYICEACGGVMAEREKPGMLRDGAWRHAMPERLDYHASYSLNSLYSPFAPWSEVAKEAEKVSVDPTTAKTFSQQWLGVAWDEAHDLPKAEVLLLRREGWQPGRVPPGVLFLVGATDVQGNRLEWAVWGFDRNFGQWLIATGIIMGDPTLSEVWAEHDQVMARRYADAWGRDIAPCAWGIDSGYLPRSVYAYAARHAHRDHDRLNYQTCQAGQFPVRALDGREGWRLPPIGTPSLRPLDWSGRQIKVRLYPVGTWDMKSELAGALRLTEAGPGPEGWPAGALRFSQAVDRAWVDELLGERFAEDPRSGKRAWKKIGKNEAWDLATYSRALARAMSATMQPSDWDALAAMTQGRPEEAQPDLLAYAPPLAETGEAPPETPPPHVAARGLAPIGRRLSGVGRSLR